MLPLLLALHFAWFIVDVIYLLQNLQILFVANLKMLFKNVWFYCALFDTLWLGLKI